MGAHAVLQGILSDGAQHYNHDRLIHLILTWYEYVFCLLALQMLEKLASEMATIKASRDNYKAQVKFPPLTRPNPT